MLEKDSGLPLGAFTYRLAEARVCLRVAWNQVGFGGLGRREGDSYGRYILLYKETMGIECPPR